MREKGTKRSRDRGIERAARLDRLIHIAKREGKRTRNRLCGCHLTRHSEFERRERDAQITRWVDRGDTRACIKFIMRSNNTNVLREMRLKPEWREESSDATKAFSSWNERVQLRSANKCERLVPAARHWKACEGREPRHKVRSKLSGLGENFLRLREQF